MKTFVLVVFFALAATATANSGFKFSENACVIVGRLEDPDCGIKPPYVTSGERVEMPNHKFVFYSNLKEAIQTCPFNPVLIEFSGTIYIDEPIKYDRHEYLWIRGVPQNNSDNTHTFVPTIVGLRDIWVIRSATNVIFDNFVLDGCGSERPIFSTDSQDILDDQTFVAANITVSNYTGQKVIAQHANSNYTYFDVEFSTFKDIEHSAISLSGHQNPRIVNNEFERCGSEDFPCVRIEAESDPLNWDMANNTYL